ncbi:MAG: lipoyl(octanoyl) transferase [Desulfuromonas sp.]|uniref:lipoyl(octanoyl) transferase LipB n=1 Tax=Desulfuromonas sp. TaxID=892 RepID=UPI000CA87758|nr:lipoyl(octanoyl) transferase LipB [Desulfuromonas sp.]PLX83878.1 MAG: lipoyl(octanoyl) transferase [Desulfuromonas sp.]
MPGGLHPLGGLAPQLAGQGGIPSPFVTLRAGRLSYRDALQLQERLLDGRRRRREDVLLLVEHPPVVTLGRGGSEAHLLHSREELARRGIEVLRTGRGGDVTYHGPGQLVGYPVVDLDPLGRDLHRYLRMLEATLIDTLAAFGLVAERIPGKTGVWVDGAKIASIGVGVRRWVSWHGFALNVAGDLTGFEAIVPCGLPGVRMTSLEGLLGRPVLLEDVESALVRAFSRVFGGRHSGEYEEHEPAL